jgi:hypothetical protein
MNPKIKFSNQISSNDEQNQKSSFKKLIIQLLKYKLQNKQFFLFANQGSLRAPPHSLKNFVSTSELISFSKRDKKQSN